MSDLRIDHHVYIHQVEGRSDPKLDRILALLDLVLNKENIIMAELDDLEAQVAAENTVIGSAVTLLDQIKAALDAAGTNPTRLKALSDLIGTNKDALAAAVVRNTPAA